MQLVYLIIDKDVETRAKVPVICICYNKEVLEEQLKTFTSEHYFVQEFYILGS